MAASTEKQVVIMRDEEEASSNVGSSNSRTHKRNVDGDIVLIPQPTDNPKDPLNWSIQKKITTIGIVSLAALAGEASHTAHLSAYVVQATYYQRPPQDLLYSICAAGAGTVAGPIIFAPFQNIIGRSSTIFWSLIATLATQVWAAEMTDLSDYKSFVVSRLFSGLFALVPAVIGSGYIVDMFFLHQRGKAFACFQLAVLLGIIGSGTIGGFVVNEKPWPYVFWWTVGPLSAAIVLVFIFVEETTFSRESKLYPSLPEGWLANRVATYFPGNRTVEKLSLNEIGKQFAAPFLIAITPITLVTGFYIFFTFGFAIVVTSMLTIYLQTPVEQGGYGFSPLRNACFTFIIWVSMFASQMTSIAVADRVPLLITRKFGNGAWKPEFRLGNVIIPTIALPLGLGLFGAGIEYHLHYMVMGLGLFFVGYSAQFNTPMCYNYIIECFRDHAIEATICMNAYRMTFGVAILFFVEPWSQAVSPGWLFGMMAFFSIFVGALMVLMAVKGHILRKFVVSKTLTATEEGKTLTA